MPNNYRIGYSLNRTNGSVKDLRGEYVVWKRKICFTKTVAERLLKHMNETGNIELFEI